MGPARSPAPGAPAVAGAAAFTAAGSVTTPDLRRFTVAPPRVSVAPPQPAPPTPAVARDQPPAPPPGAPDTVRRALASGASLVEATAHLFGASPSSSQPGAGAPVIRRALSEGDTIMPPPPPPSPPSWSSPSPGGGQWGGSDDGPPSVAGDVDPLPSGIAFDALVDAVVQRIERKVIDEMERRGRWHAGELY